MSRFPGAPAPREPVRFSLAPSSPVPTTGELVAELSRLSRCLNVAMDELRREAADYATKEDAYRLARAQHILTAREALRDQGIAKATVDEVNAHVDLLTSRERLGAHLADGMHQAAREAVRCLIAQLSALQSVAAAVRSEAELAGRSPAT